MMIVPLVVNQLKKLIQQTSSLLQPRYYKRGFFLLKRLQRKSYPLRVSHL
ncbi:MAG: hypothetical protein K0Q87_5328 [Neobacillus sp.]|nr:hypothetical protein [Neobacillus sp.]